MANRREPRENGRTSRTNLSIDLIFYSYYVSPSLDALIPCELPTVPKISSCLVPSGLRDIILYRPGFIEVAYTCHFRSIRNVCVWRHDELVRLLYTRLKSQQLVTGFLSSALPRRHLHHQRRQSNFACSPRSSHAALPSAAQSLLSTATLPSSILDIERRRLPRANAAGLARARRRNHASDLTTDSADSDASTRDATHARAPGDAHPRDRTARVHPRPRETAPRARRVKVRRVEVGREQT